MDYSKSLLIVQKPISFHKFWQLDPISVYEEWFAADDVKLHAQLAESKITRTDKIKVISNGMRNDNNGRHKPLINVELKTNHAEL